MTTQLFWPRKGVSLGFPPVEDLNEVFAWRKASIRFPRPLLLDLFCGAGGASMGYYRAGFDVIGLDIVRYPNYPFPQIVTDAISWTSKYWYYLRHGGHSFSDIAHGFDAVHASPPCQRWSQMSNCRTGLRQQYPDHLNPIRYNLQEYATIPWVIENVPGAPLIKPVMLCGFMFGFELYRHRLFETGGGVGCQGGNWDLDEPEHPEHRIPGSRAGHWAPGQVISVSGHCAPMWKARREMDISWTNRAELAEAVPPYYTQYVGAKVMDLLALNDPTRFQYQTDLTRSEKERVA